MRLAPGQTQNVRPISGNIYRYWATRLTGVLLQELFLGYDCVPSQITELKLLEQTVVCKAFMVLDPNPYKP